MRGEIVPLLTKGLGTALLHRYTMEIWAVFSDSLFLVFVPRASDADRASRAAGRGRHVPVDQTQRQLHHRGRAHHPQGGGVQDHHRQLGRDSHRGLSQLQAVAPGPRRGVRDPSAADAPRGRGHGAPRATPHHQNQVCRWGCCAPLPS